MRCVLLCMLEVVDGREVLEVLEVIRRVLCMSEAAEGELCLSVSEAPEVMRCVLLCMLEAVEGEVWLLEALTVLEVLVVIRCMRLYAGGCGA